MVEHAFECLQQGNALQCINSSNYNIILSFLLFNITAALLKFYLMVTALIRAGRDLLSVSFLKVHSKLHIFHELFESSTTRKDPTIREV